MVVDIDNVFKIGNKIARDNQAALDMVFCVNV